MWAQEPKSSLELHQEGGRHDWVLRGMIDAAGSCDDPATVDTGRLHFNHGSTDPSADKTLALVVVRVRYRSRGWRRG